METAINVLVILLVSVVVIYVQSFMGGAITEEEISDAQKMLDELKTQDEDGIWKNDTEGGRDWLLYSQKQEKGVVLLFMGIFLISILIILALVTSPSLTNIAVISISAISLICHGMIKLVALAKVFLFQVVVFLIMVGVFAILIFDKPTTMPVHTYFYLWGAITFFGIFSLFHTTEKA